MKISKVKRPLVKKLIFRIAVPLLLIYLLVLVYNVNNARERALRDTKNYLQELTAHHACMLNLEFNEIAAAANSLAQSVNSFALPSEEKLLSYINDIIKTDPDNAGTGISFEPDAAAGHKGLYSPFVFREGSGYINKDLADSYNYLNESWYLIPRLLEKPYWTEPFYGKVSKSLLATCTVPVLQNGKLKGIAAADLSLSDLGSRISGLSVMGGYSFIITRNGTFIYHPQKSFIMRETIFSISQQYNIPELRQVGRDMIAGKSGSARISDMTTKEKKWLVYATVPTTNWSFAAVIPEKEIMSAVNTQARNQLYIMLAGLVLIIAIIIWSAFKITEPIIKLQNMSARIAEGDLDLDLEIKTHDEIQALAESFNKMVLDLKHYITDLTTATRAQEAVESELRIARQIQESLLPRIFPPFPDRAEFSLKALNIPAKEVAGDFYDFFFLDDDRLALIIADVSGKGIAAGLFMAVTRTLIKTVCQNCSDPAQALKQANQILCQENDACMFTTLFLGIYHVHNGILDYANAGHNSPFIIHEDGKADILKASNDMALGIFYKQEYHRHTASLGSKDLLIMYTDGVTEATSPQNELFGEERMVANIQKSLKQPVSTIVDELEVELSSFQKNNQFDDITYLVMRRNN